MRINEKKLKVDVEDQWKVQDVEAWKKMEN